jgi:hypothetical protein
MTVAGGMLGGSGISTLIVTDVNNVLDKPLTGPPTRSTGDAAAQFSAQSGQSMLFNLDDARSPVDGVYTQAQIASTRSTSFQNGPQQTQGGKLDVSNSLLTSGKHKASTDGVGHTGGLARTMSLV